MTKRANALRLEQVDSVLVTAGKCLNGMKVPSNGWVRAIRQSLGMTSTQLAGRMGISQPSALETEARERDGGITLNALRKAANALGCELHYVLVPKTSLASARHAQAEHVAKQRVSQIAHSMSLEQQPMSNAAIKSAVDAQVEEILEKPRDLWT